MSKPNRTAVILIGAAVVVLLVVGSIFWHMHDQDLQEATIARAQKQWDEGLYRDAQRTLLSLVDDVGQTGGLNLFDPRRAILKSRSKNASVMLCRIRIETQIRTTTPDWLSGLDELKDFIVHHRDDENFSDLHEAIRAYAKEISLGAVKTAQDLAKKTGEFPKKDRATILNHCKNLTELSRDAEKLRQRYSR